MNHTRRQLREITTSGATGGFQSSVVGFVSPLRRKKMTPTQVDRFHADLKRALGQSESSMSRNHTVRRIDAVLSALSEGYTGWEDLDDDATELRVFIDNDADLYRGQTTSIHKNLMTKIGQGKYNRDLAVKLFMYLVDAGAQKYVKEYGTADQPWNKLFPKKTRELVAASLRNHFESEAALGNYNNYLPAKYSTVDVAAALAAAGFKPE